jgi:hypothetical protein
MRFPKIDDVATELRAINKQQSAPDGDDGGIDVRLQVYPDGDWAVRWGSSDYDQDHRGYWGASSVPGDNRRFDSKDLARDLIDQAKEHFAQGDDDGVLEENEDDGEDDEEEGDEGDESEDEEDEDLFSDEEMASGYVISDSRGGGYDVVNEHKHVGHYKDMDEALSAIEEHMKASNWFPNVYYVNERGNVDLLDGDGSVIESRV